MDLQDRGGNKPSGWRIWLPFLFSLVLVVGILLGMRMDSLLPAMVVEAGSQAPVSLKDQSKLEELLRYIEAKYVDEVDREELIDEAIERVLE
jgi:carboxyl-terminal processing protease